MGDDKFGEGKMVEVSFFSLFFFSFVSFFIYSLYFFFLPFMLLKKLPAEVSLLLEGSTAAKSEKTKKEKKDSFGFFAHVSNGCSLVLFNSWIIMVIEGFALIKFTNDLS